MFRRSILPTLALTLATALGERSGDMGARAAARHLAGIGLDRARRSRRR